MEAEDLEYAERFAAARKREAQLRKLTKGHVRKKMVKVLSITLAFSLTLCYFQRLSPDIEPLRQDDDEETAFLPEEDEDSQSNISPAVLDLM